MTRCQHGWKREAALVIVAVVCVISCSHGPSDGSALPLSSEPAASGTTAPSASATASRASVPKDPLAAFELVRVVLQDPRCQNCHPPGETPIQGDEGRPHDQNVVRGPAGDGPPGEACSTCHGLSNPPASYGSNIPPGAPGWRMPGPEMKMVFVGMSSRSTVSAAQGLEAKRGQGLYGSLAPRFPGPARPLGMVTRSRSAAGGRPPRRFRGRVQRLGRRRRALPAIARRSGCGFARPAEFALTVECAAFALCSFWHGVLIAVGVCCCFHRGCERLRREPTVPQRTSGASRPPGGAA